MLENAFGPRACAALRGALRVGAATLAIGVATQACATEGDGRRSRRGLIGELATKESGRAGDPCAPGAAPLMSAEPLGTCATANAHHVPDLTRRGANLGGPALGTGLSTQS